MFADASNSLLFLQESKNESDKVEEDVEVFTPELEQAGNRSEATTEEGISNADDSAGNHPGGISKEHENECKTDVEKSESTVDIDGATSTHEVMKDSLDNNQNSDAPSSSIM